MMSIWDYIMVHAQKHCLLSKTNTPSVYIPCTFQQLIFWNETAMHLLFTYICHAHPTGQHMYARPLIFHILCCFKAAYRINTYNPIIQVTYINVSHLSFLQWCCLGNRLCSYIPPWGMLLHIGVIGIQLILSSHHHCPKLNE